MCCSERPKTSHSRSTPLLSHLLCEPLTGPPRGSAGRPQEGESVENHARALTFSNSAHIFQDKSLAPLEYKSAVSPRTQEENRLCLDFFLRDIKHGIRRVPGVLGACVHKNRCLYASCTDRTVLTRPPPLRRQHRAGPRDTTSAFCAIKDKKKSGGTSIFC